MIGYYHLLGFLGPALYWALMLLLTMGALCCAAFALRFPRRLLVIISAAALAAAVIMAAAPTPPAPDVMPALLGTAALALSIVGGGPAVQFVLALASRGSVPNGNHGGIVVSTDTPTDTQADRVTRHEVLRGGSTIGFLERLAATGAIMSGFPAGIAVLAAIKGIGRFTELDAAEARERFIIGTLTSLVWACACGALFHFAIG